MLASIQGVRLLTNYRPTKGKTVSINEKACEELEKAIALTEVLQIVNPGELSDCVLRKYAQTIESTVQGALDIMLGSSSHSTLKN